MTVTATPPPHTASGARTPVPPGGPARPARRTGTDPLVLVPTLLGALAVLGGSTALMPLMEGAAWLLPLVEVVAVVWLVGIATRALAVPAWGVGLLQLAGLLIALTSLFTTTGVLGVLPGPAAFAEGGRLLGGAWQQILTTVPPAPDTPELGLLIGLSIGALALVVDVLVAGVRVPALVALPLLSLYSVPASIDTKMLPWYAFAVPAALFAALLVVAGHTGWQPARRAQTAMATSATAITAVAIVAALVLAGLATPIGTAGRLPRGGHGGDVGLNPWALLHGDLTNRTPEDTLRVTGLAAPAYLRTLALERWTPDQGFTLGPVVGDDANLDGTIPGAPAPDDSSATVTVTPQKYRDAYLPIYQRSTKVTGLATGWDYDRGLQTVFRDGAIVPQQYTVTANTAPVPTKQLEADTVQSGGALTETGQRPVAVVDQARSITADAHTAFDAAQDVLHYFTDPANGFTYSLRVPTGNSGSALLDFLTSKQGYCEQYAAAMAIMLRSLGIPARVAIGFTQGTEQADGSYQIESTDAHAWVEVKFDKSGWVAFDPTPVVGGQGGLQGFDTAGGVGGPSPATGTAKTTTTSAFPSSLEAGPIATTRQQLPGWEPTYGLGGGTDQTPSIWGWLLPVLIAVATVLLLGLLIAAPAWIRRRRRRRRLAVASGGRPGAGSAAWEEIADTLTDHGIAMHDVESARVTANRLARTAHLSTTGREDLRTVVMTAEREWYGSPGGDGSDPVPDLTPGVRAVVDGLERSAPRPWIDRFLPRSLRIGNRRAR
jgi:transglutaminase-like putative cysteine protease